MRSVRTILCAAAVIVLCFAAFIMPASAWTVVFNHYPTPTVGSGPEGICAGPDGNVWFVEAIANKVGKITPAGAITEYALAGTSAPIDICTGPDGNLWLTQSGDHTITRMDTSGTILNQYPLAVGTNPNGICLGPDGNLWYTAPGTNKIGKITTAGAITEYALDTPFSAPMGICAGPDGALWFANNNSDEIGRITTAGAITEYALAAFSGPREIAPGPDGALWYTAFGTSKVGRITTAGAITEYATPTATAGPTGIVHGPGGVMWVCLANIKSFARVRMDGTMTEHLICLGAGDPPVDVCTGPDGNLWWTESGGPLSTCFIGQGVTDSPYIFGITPDTGARGSTVSVTDLDGNNFGTGGKPTVKLTRDGQPDIAATNVTLVSPNQITCDFAIPAGAALGAWNVVVVNGDGQSDTLSDGFEVTGGAPPASTWYLAEGATAGDFETWVLVQNPNGFPVTVDLTLMTETGPENPPALQGVNIPASSRTSFNIGAYVQTFDVSTKVDSYGGGVVCERAMYGNSRTWGTDSIGTKLLHNVWYLAEGCTAGDFETWVLVMNPNDFQVAVDLNFMTSSGPVPGPQDYPIPAHSRHSFNAGASVVDWDVSTQVLSPDGVVVCERAMYGNGRTWAHDSVGVTSPSPTWYMAEGCTMGGMETWVLVQNPGAAPVTVDLTLMTETGPQNPPALQDVPIPGNSRMSFNLGQYVQTYDVSTQVDATGGPVVCERAVYGADRVWGTDSIGSDVAAGTWLLAEGCTAGDFETWVLVMNPNAVPVTVDLDFMTSAGPQAGPQDVLIPPYSRMSFNAGLWVTDWNVSTQVISTGGSVVCERAMYGNGRVWAHDSVGYPAP